MNLNRNLNAATAAAFLLAGLALSAAPAGAAPGPSGPDTLSNDSPTSVTHTGVGKATVKDANGIKFVTHYEDDWHATSKYPAKSCTKEWAITQHYPILGQKFTVTDCQGNKKSFTFQAHT